MNATANTTVDQSVVIPLLSYASDPNGDPLTVTDPSFSYTDSGTIVTNGDGTITYTPAARLLPAVDQFSELHGVQRFIERDRHRDCQRR